VQLPPPSPRHKKSKAYNQVNKIYRGHQDIAQLVLRLVIPQSRKRSNWWSLGDHSQHCDKNAKCCTSVRRVCLL